jgi:DNA repair protein RecN (Recombination protein N)
MLKNLKIGNIALVVDADLAFDKGLTVLTGETGAGKSVIVTALSLVLGERADRDFIRHGADRATVEASFSASTMTPQYRKEYANYILEGQITVAREISLDGTSKVKINGASASLARLREITAPVAEILGQHANQMLMDEENHLLFLDHFAGVESQRDFVGELFAEWEKTSAELRRTTAKHDQLAKERELLLFQKNEIDKANIRAGEEESLVAERRILDSARSLMNSAAIVQNLLDSEENSAIGQLRLARKELDRMAEVDKKLEAKAGELSEIELAIEELRRFVEQYGSSIPDDPARLEEINLRLDEIYVLKKKYGGSEEAILKTLDVINQQLADRPDIDGVIEALRKDTERLFKEYAVKARELTEVRVKAADYIRKLVIKELTELAIDKAEFRFEFLYEDDPDGVILDGRAVKPFAHGLENGRFLFSANPGEPAKSLVKTASGGEISRVLLALKAAEKKNSQLQRSLLVFDEVDAGIGGKTAGEVGRKLKRLSEGCQVMVVTHLHQIARLADHHFVAEKTRKQGGRSVIVVRKLDAPGITEEIARMVALPETPEKKPARR